MAALQWSARRSGCSGTHFGMTGAPARRFAAVHFGLPNARTGTLARQRRPESSLAVQKNRSGLLHRTQIRPSKRVLQGSLGPEHCLAYGLQAPHSPVGSRDVFRSCEKISWVFSAVAPF